MLLMTLQFLILFNRVAHSAGPGIGISALLRSGSLYLFLFGGPGWFGGSGWLGVGLGLRFGLGF